tara:strand:- start:710 stop:970 length:261 start_codon:yes stop_codon:yes gene_type:complete
MSNDITILSNRLTNKFELVLKELNMLKKNIDELNKIINKQEPHPEPHPEPNPEPNPDPELEPAGRIDSQRNMSHNIWISSLRNRWN